MKITDSNLASHDIEKLIINSLEQSLYQAIVVIAGQEHVVWTSSGKTLTTRNLAQMREHFEAMDIPQIVLRQESAFDEMIGFERGNDTNRMEIPLGHDLYPLPGGE